jgi:predicted HTH transcriptional regulator
LKAYDKSIFKISDNFIQVVFPIDNANEEIPHREEEILRQIKLNPSTTMSDISRHLGASVATVERDFGNLKKKKS